MTEQPAPPTREVLMAVHEEVFRAWPALKTAIAARSADLQIRTWLSHDAEQWSTSGGGPVTMPGGRLALALDWSRRNPREVTAEVRKYLDAAVRQHRMGLIVRVALAGLAGILLVVGAFAYQAIQARNVAEASRLATDARATFGSRLDLGLLLALEARARSGDPQSQAMPLVGLAQGPGPRRYERPAGIGSIDSGALDASGSRAVLPAADAITLWDAANDRLVATIPGGAGLVGISDDGSTVAFWRKTGDRSGTIDVARWPDGTTLKRCDVTGEAQSIHVSPTGAFVVAITIDPDDPTGEGDVTVLSATDCTGPSPHGAGGSVVDVDIDGDRIAWAMGDAGARIWNRLTGDELTFSSDRSITAVAFAGDDRLGGTSTTGDLLVWDATSGESTPQVFAVFDADVAGVRLEPVPDENVWVVGSELGDIRVIQTAPRVTLLASTRSLPAIGEDDQVGNGSAFDENDGTAGALDLAVTEAGAVTIDGRARIITWDLVGIPPLGGQVFAGGRIDRLRALPNGSLIAGGPKGVWLLDGANGDVVGHRDTAAVTAIGPGRNGWVIGLASGEVLRSSGSMDSLTKVATVNGPVRAVAALDSGQVGIADNAGAVTLVEPSGAVSTIALTRPVYSLAGAGRWLLAGSDDRILYVVDPSVVPPVIQESELPVFGQVNTLEVGADATTLAIGGDGRTIVMGTIASDGKIQYREQLIGHTDRVNTLSISPDGHSLASSGEDAHVMLWNLDTSERVGDPIPVGREPVVAFGRSGDRQLFVSDDRGGLVRWDMRPEAWVRTACELIGGRTFTRLERDQFLGGGSPSFACPGR